MVGLREHVDGCDLLQPVSGPDEECGVTSQRCRVARHVAESPWTGGDYDFDARQLPSDPVALCYWAASVLPVPARHKQPLLAVDTVGGLLADTLAMYRRELSFLENMVAHMHVSQAGPFSRN